MKVLCDLKEAEQSVRLQGPIYTLQSGPLQFLETSLVPGGMKWQRAGGRGVGGGADTGCLYSTCGDPSPTCLCGQGQQAGRHPNVHLEIHL